MSRLKLAAGAWEMEILPALGGSVAALRRGGRDILRPAPVTPENPLDTGCFPLVPYANRIAEGRFAFAGQAHRLPLNFGDHPHSLHGLGWQRPWEVLASKARSATLHHAHDGSAGWPWAYRAGQTFTLDESGLEITLALTNTGVTPMPGGLGLHPYFPVDSDTVLQFSAQHMWLADATMLPTDPVPAAFFADWHHGAAVARETLVDHAFEGWDGQATLGDIRISATGACAMHLFIPPGAGFVCVEPVSHLPDAVNRPEFGRDIVLPGGSIGLSLRITV